ncbi:MAG TPA: cyclic nucleotide-binding domain-containing protein [Candidatus Baltobacteraceae bacterium]|jgi:CRP-like cAMP-binding protein
MTNGEMISHAGGDVVSVAKDETVFLHGSIGAHMYVVLDGQVEIRIGERVVDVVSPGQFFGEMALVDERPRAGTAIARTKGSLLRIDSKQFLKLVRESPDFALKLLRVVVGRVRRADSLGGLTVPTKSSTQT